MTLTIAYVDSFGAWVSADRRITVNASSGRDNAQKLFGFGKLTGRALVTVAGFVHGGFSHLAWYEALAREMDGNVSRATMLEHLRISMQETFAGPAVELNKPITLSIAGFWQGTPLLATVENGRVRNQFAIVEYPWDQGAIVFGGRPKTVHEAERQQLRKTLKSTRSREQKARTIAALNRSASRHPEAGGTVSPECFVCFLPPEPGSAPTRWLIDPDGKMTLTPFAQTGSP